MLKPIRDRVAIESLEPRFLLSGAMIVTTEALAEAFGDVADWYTRKGYPAEVVTIESIDANYQGVDTQERIRNCIRDYHENLDILYVLLGGDSSVVPDRDTSRLGDQDVPTDLYYSSLGGQWDADADGIFGEVSDDMVTFDYDTIVGRYPVQTPEQVETILGKVMAYETAPPQGDWANDMLAVGNKLWSTGDAQQKSIQADSTYVRANWANRNLDMFFDTETSWDSAIPGDYLLNSQNLLSAMGGGYQFMHVATHGSKTSWSLESGRLDSGTIGGITESLNVPIVSTVACHTGAFDLAEASLSEAFLRSDNTGTIVYIGSSREGWGIPGDWLGPSFRYSYAFYEQFLVGSTQIAGEVFAEMKADLGPMSAYEGPMRWLQLAINFQGDPLVQMYRNDPIQLDPTFEGQTTQGRQTYEVTDVPAGARVVLRQEGDLYVVGIADGAGDFSTSISPKTGTMQMTVIARDAAVFTTEISVVATAPAPISFTQAGALVAYGLGQPSGGWGSTGTSPVETPVATLVETPAQATTTRTVITLDYGAAAPARASDGDDPPDATVDRQAEGSRPAPDPRVEHGQGQTETTADILAPAVPPAGADNSNAPATHDSGGSDVLVTTETIISVDLTSGWDLEGGARRFTV